jgi:hypothetical protein
MFIVANSHGTLIGVEMFVYEEISSEDQALVGFPDVRDYWGHKLSPYMWAIDRSRDYYLIEGGPKSIDDPKAKSYLFGWEGQKIRFALTCQTKRTSTNTADWHWTRVSDFIVGCRDRRPIILPTDVIGAVKEALVTRVNAFHKATNITFEF